MPPSSWQPVDTRDELILSLMASEAVIDSREYQILNADDVELLKKEHTLLTSRLEAQSKKLSREIKIRDAALSLSRVNASHKKISKQTEDQLTTANQRVESAQVDLARLTDRASEIHRTLLEHRAAVLSFSVRALEKKVAADGGSGSGDSGYDSSNRSTLLSPVSPAAKFDGAHLFAGHADAVQPKRTLSVEAAGLEITALERKLTQAKESLSDASKKHADMLRELSHMRLEKQEVETMLGMDLQAAEETIASLEKELPRIEDLSAEVAELQAERAQLLATQSALQTQLLDTRTREASDTGSTQLALNELRQKMEAELRTKDSEIQALRDELARTNEDWELERQAMEDEKMDDLARLHDELDRAREDDARAAREEARGMLAGAVQDLSRLLAVHGVNAPNPSTNDEDDDELSVLVNALNIHLETKTTEWSSQRSRLEADVRAAQDERTTVLRDLDAAKQRVFNLETRLADSQLQLNSTSASNANGHNRDSSRTSTAHLRTLSTAQSASTSSTRPTSTTSASTTSTSITIPIIDYDPTIDLSAPRIISILQPLFAILPSPEARAAKFGGGARSFRTGSPTPALPGTGGANANGAAAGTVPGTPGAVVASLSDLDVRALKTLYTGAASGAGGGTAPLSPRTVSSNGLPPNTPNNTTTNGTIQTQQPFSVQAFAQRVQALIADDKALIERLMRFAQAHDLLKKNAERAQKLAQDGTHALETYQKQVRVLEERCSGLGARGVALQEEVDLLHDTIERLTDEKRELERLAAAQAEDCAQLTEANNTLSQRTLTLAEEAAQAPERVRRQLELQINEVKKELGEARMMLDEAKRRLEERGKELEEARGEVEVIVEREQAQGLKMMDMVNDVQNENEKLRAQLRAVAAATGKK